MKRPIVWAAIFTICGIYMRLGISEMMCLVSFIFIALSTLHFVIKEKAAKYLLLLLFAALGFLSAGYHLEGEKSEIMPDGILRGEGVIKEAGVTSSGNQKLKMVCDLQDETGTSLTGVTLYVLWNGEDSFAAGEKVTFSGELAPFYKPSYPGGYDEELFLTTKGFDYKLYPDTMSHLEKDTSISSVLARGRAYFSAVLERILPVEESGIMKAFLTGE